MPPKDKIFTDGIYLNRVSDQAPEYIKANISINIDKAIAWLDSMRNHADDKGFIKITGKESQAGKRYFELDTWKPTTQPANSPSALPAYPDPVDDGGIDMPF